MFGLGFSEIIVVAVIALIFLGPDQLPELARTLGRFMNELKRSTDSIKEDFKSQVNLDFEQKRNEVKNSHENSSLHLAHDQQQPAEPQQEQMDLFSEENMKKVSENQIAEVPPKEKKDHE